jgi:proliferating cell nuclear antigen
MFQAKIKASILKEVVDAVSIIIDEVKFHVSPEGMVLRAVDQSHVAMIDLSLRSKAFDEYKATEMDMGIDITKLSDVLKLAGPDDVVSMNYNEEARKLVFKVGNISRTAALLDTASMTDPKVPNLNLPVKIVVKSMDLDKGIRGAQTISDHVTLIAEATGFELSAEGDTDAVNLKLPKDLLVSVDCKEKARSVFSLDYFANMVKASRNVETVTIQMGTDYPVKIDFDVADDKGHVSYLLAPRIESE